MEERQDYEKSVPDMNLENDKFVDISSTNVNLKTKKYKKKKRGIAGFFQRLGEKWRNMRKWKKATVITLTVLFLIVAVAFGFVADLLKDYNYDAEISHKKPEELGFENVIDQRVVNVALFGIDSRGKGFKGNSDSMMILSIDTEAKTVKIVSVVRDTLVPIEVNGKVRYRKLNSAYATGGPALAIKTFNQCFGLDISEYATVNFNGMAEIIDAVGGIEAELLPGEVVPAAASKNALNEGIYEFCTLRGIDPEPYYILKPGKYHLNGIQAVAYSRIRKTKNVWGTNNDYGRTDRQRHVMEQLFNKALTLPKSEYLGLVKAMLPYTETSLSLTEIMGLAWDVMLKSPTFAQSRVPLTEYQMPGKSIKGVGDCVYYDLDYAKDLLHAFFYDNITPEDYIKQNGVRKNDWYANATGNAGITTPTTPPEDDGTSSTPSTDDGTSSDVNSGGDVTLPPDNNTSSNPDDTTTEN